MDVGASALFSACEHLLAINDHLDKRELPGGVSKLSMNAIVAIAITHSNAAGPSPGRTGAGSIGKMW
jgi:hypothetical protein